MALYKNKWEVKTWAELSASVGDSSNALEFRPKHRLPRALQQGAKASKKAGGFFNRESILKSADYPGGFFIYDTGSGLSYTAMPKAEFKSDATNFLMSSSLSSTAKAQISASFNAQLFPDLVVQIDSSSYTGSVTGSGPATASWYVPCAFIGNGAGTLKTLDQSTNHTGIQLQAAGHYITGSVSNVEFTLPMETMSFTGTFESQSLKFASFTGSEYTSLTYESSSIYTPHGGTQTTSSIIGTIFGSGSNNIHPRGLYTWVDHGGYIKALGDGIDAIYDYGEKLDILHFPSGSVVTSSHFTARYDKLDTNMTGSSGSAGVVYYVSGSLTSTGSQAIGFWDNTFNGTGSSQIANNQDSGSHLFADAALATPAAEGIYIFSGLLPTSGSMVKIPSTTGARVPRFTGFKH